VRAHARSPGPAVVAGARQACPPPVRLKSSKEVLEGVNLPAEGRDDSMKLNQTTKHTNS
jgi:hypothetical protein